MGVRSLKSGLQTGSLYASNDSVLEVLAIGGGGGGAGSGSIYGGSGGGGAGGCLYKETIFPIGSFSVVIGAGGTGGPTTGSGKGSYPTATTITGPKVYLYAYPGGIGGPGATDGGEFGGSAGGGDSHIPASWYANGSVPGQGNGQTEPRQRFGSGGNGGGGAGAPGSFPFSQNGQAGFGGIGVGHYHEWAVATSTGSVHGNGGGVSSRRYYAGGGGGGHSVYYGAPYNQNNAGPGGGGYGSGNSQAGYTLNAGTAGTANTGSGGGGGGANGTTYTVGYAGGSGIVIIRYLTGVIAATGGTIATSGGYTYHTFTSNGTFARTA
jgi:hypothetical protein